MIRQTTISSCRATVWLLAAGLVIGLGACKSSTSPSFSRGNVELRNFTPTPVSMIKQGETASSGNVVAPQGTRVVTVDDRVGSSTTFHVVSGGTTLATVTCTVTNSAWISVNPDVAWVNGVLVCTTW